MISLVFSRLIVSQLWGLSGTPFALPPLEVWTSFIVKQPASRVEVPVLSSDVIRGVSVDSKVTSWQTAVSSASTSRIYATGCGAAGGGPARRHVCGWFGRPAPPDACSLGNRWLSFDSGGGWLCARWRKMASPRTVTIVALSFALGLFFVFMGTIKLTPRLSKDAYSEMVSES